MRQSGKAINDMVAAAPAWTATTGHARARGGLGQTGRWQQRISIAYVCAGTLQDDSGDWTANYVDTANTF